MANPVGPKCDVGGDAVVPIGVILATFPNDEDRLRPPQANKKRRPRPVILLTAGSAGGLKNEVGSNQRLIRGPFIYDYLLEKNDYLLRKGDVYKSMKIIARRF